MPPYRIITYVERPELDDAWEEVVHPAWPEFLYHDAVCNEWWGGLNERFPDSQLYLLDDATGEVVGWGNAIPFAWDGDPATLPAGGIDGVLPLGFSQSDQGTAPTTLCALQAVVHPARRGTGLSRELIDGMRRAAAAHGLTDLVAPVRPNRKDRYPLTRMERYVTWTSPDDPALPFDPWMRVHARMGATIEGVCHGSNVVEGTVAEWERWTRMAFPETGDYVVPGALVPVRIDRERDLGRLSEPNVWMRHPVG